MNSDKKKYSSDEAIEIYFKAAEHNAKRVFNKFCKKLELGSSEVESSDVVQMEIERIKDIVKSDYDLIKAARLGFTDVPTKELIDYLSEELQKNEVYIPVKPSEYKQFNAIEAYKYLKKLEELLPRLERVKLAHEFAQEIFNPKKHDRQKIEAYLTRWIMNQDQNYPRAATISGLNDEYPDLEQMQTGETIPNWETKFKKFYHKRTGKSFD